jgi:hypothetical protein
MMTRCAPCIPRDLFSHSPSSFSRRDGGVGSDSSPWSCSSEVGGGGSDERTGSGRWHGGGGVTVAGGRWVGEEGRVT